MDGVNTLGNLSRTVEDYEDPSSTPVVYEESPVTSFPK
jgi:hypothetical protein